jgi:beta-mannosidase
MGQLASYDTRSGDMHYWGVWHGLNPLSDFRKYKARFMSEYGFQSFPEFNSVKKYTLPEDHNIESEVMMAAHQRSGIGNLRIRQYMEADYIIPEDFEQFLYVGQLLQAEAIKLAIESHRAEIPYCMGSLYWQINDCWPVASWSGIDYYGKWKALHYFVREAFKPTVIICDEDADSIFLDVVSDSDEIGNLKLEIRLMDFKGSVLWQSFDEIDSEEPGNSFSLGEILGNTDPASVVLVSELKQDDKTIDTDFHYFVKPKDLQLIDPQVKMEIKDKGENIEVVLTCNSLAKNVFLYADGLEGQFSDNYFDLLPGESMTVSVPKSGYSPEVFESLNVLHLFLAGNLAE